MRAATAGSDRDPRERNRSSPWRAHLLVLVVMLVGAALRLPGIAQAPPGLYHDEAYHGLDALQVLEGDLALYFEANNGREPLFIYLVAGAIAAVGVSPIAVRLPSFYVGVLTLAATYDLARTLWGRRAGRWALAVLAATFWHVHLSRIGFRAVLLPLFTALYLSQAVRAIRTGRVRHWILSGALYGASWYTYMAARFTPIAIAAMLVYALCRHRRWLRRHWRDTLLGVAAALLVLLPLGIYTLRHPEVVLSRTGQVSVFSEEIHQGRFWETLADHTLRTLGMFTIRGDRIWRHNLAWRPVWDPALGLAFILGLGVAIGRCRRDTSATLVLIWSAIMALPTVLAEDAPHFLRAVGVLPTVALLPAVGLDWLQSYLARASSDSLVGDGWLRSNLHHLPALLVLFGLASTGYDYFVRYQAAPLTYHWFEAGPAELAGQINEIRGEGWTGTRMLHGSEADAGVYLDPQIWAGWTAVPFLLSGAEAQLLPLAKQETVGDAAIFAVWPYRDWEADVLPYLPHPSYLQVIEGPPAQGDLDLEPFTTALIVTAGPRPEVPAPIARFEEGILLRAALVQWAPDTDPTVQLWWEPTETIALDYTVFVHYLRDGERIAQDDRAPGLGHLRTPLWEPGDLILDAHRISGVVPQPGRDILRIGLFDPATGEVLERMSDVEPSAESVPVADAMEVPVILVEP